MDEELTELAHDIRDELARRFPHVEVLDVTIDENPPVDDRDVVGVNVVYRQRDPDARPTGFPGAVRFIRPLIRDFYESVFPLMRFLREEDAAELARAR